LKALLLLLIEYARQAGDSELRKMADRIQARALDRCGELLRAIPAEKGGQPWQKSTNGGTPISRLTPREQAARAAGLSKDQQNTALRINNFSR